MNELKNIRWDNPTSKCLDSVDYAMSAIVSTSPFRRTRHFSVDNALFFEVILAMDQRGFSFHMTTASGRYFVRFTHRESQARFDFEYIAASWAVCIAALKALGELR